MKFKRDKKVFLFYGVRNCRLYINRWGLLWYWSHSCGLVTRDRLDGIRHWNTIGWSYLNNLDSTVRNKQSTGEFNWLKICFISFSSHRGVNMIAGSREHIVRNYQGRKKNRPRTEGAQHCQIVHGVQMSNGYVTPHQGSVSNRNFYWERGD